MSRIYENKALQNKPVINERLDYPWRPSAHQSGPGVILEGKLVDVSRHVITDVNKQKDRYYILYVTPSRVHRRKFDSKGNEIEPNFSETRKVNTGFLMSSFKVEAKGESDRLSEDELKAVVRKAELLKVTETHAPPGTVSFWLPEGEMEKTELEPGQDIRLKTKGDGPFIFSLAKLDGGSVTKCNFAGDEQTGASWTDKIMANKAGSDSVAKCEGGAEGVDESEWDD
ncbi:arpin isoform X2 [Paramormyrops kingsleyae]|uniref:Arpin n=1 Tax=Paramormyrops kingsleyae TaxID=1676925 RepID=A0A3B3Q766_9TELE|nr:arpin isoform X2 [Paramormyrops kingsleyae]